MPRTGARHVRLARRARNNAFLHTTYIQVEDVMKTNNATILLMMAMLIAGCMTPGEIDDDEEFGTTGDMLVPASSPFIHHRIEHYPHFLYQNCIESRWPEPPEGGVVVGVHAGWPGVICAKLNFGYRVRDRYTDRYTQVSSGPAMHGCAPNYFIERIFLGSSGGEYTCVSLETSDGEALTYSGTLHDGRGSTVTASVPTYGISPNMHVCPVGFAVVGFHRAENDLYCAKISAPPPN